MNGWPANKAWLKEQIIDLLGTLPDRLETSTWIAPGLVPRRDLVSYTREKWLPPGHGSLTTEAWRTVEQTIEGLIHELEVEGRLVSCVHDRSNEGLYELHCVRQISLLEAVAMAASDSHAGHRLLDQENGHPADPRELPPGDSER